MRLQELREPSPNKDICESLKRGKEKKEEAEKKKRKKEKRGR